MLRSSATCGDPGGAFAVAARVRSRGPTEVLLAFVDPVLQPWAQPYGAMIVREAVRARGIAAEVVLPFLRADPIGFESGDINLYRYVRNNPVFWIDNWGLRIIYGGKEQTHFRR